VRRQTSRPALPVPDKPESPPWEVPERSPVCGIRDVADVLEEPGLELMTMGAVTQLPVFPQRSRRTVERSCPLLCPRCSHGIAAVVRQFGSHQRVGYHPQSRPCRVSPSMVGDNLRQQQIGPAGFLRGSTRHPWTRTTLGAFADTRIAVPGRTKLRLARNRP
jgi:hypothetical protein